MSGDASNALKEDSTKLGIVIFCILLFGKNFAIQYFFSSHMLRELFWVGEKSENSQGKYRSKICGHFAIFQFILCSYV